MIPRWGFIGRQKILGLMSPLLRTWRTEEGEQIAALQREVRILREERDILKKATEFFVKERK